MRNLQEFLHVCASLVAELKPMVIVTLVGRQGHIPQEVGARAIATADGLVWGTVGGGRLEASAIEHSKKLIEEKVQLPERQTINLRAELGMVCGGVAELLFEPWQPHATWTIAVFGAGHVAQAVVPLISTFDCEVIQLDTRADLLARTPEKPNVRKVCVPDLAAAVSALPPHTYFVLMTQGHATDLPIARAILRRGLPRYLGVIGSEVKAKTLKAELTKAGFASEWIDAVHCPLGLPIGANIPAEIAVSCAAELLAVRQKHEPERARLSTR